jgi:hypothetical protein
MPLVTEDFVFRLATTHPVPQCVGSCRRQLEKRGATTMASAITTPKANGKQAKPAKAEKAAPKPAAKAEPKEVAYNGYCIARSFYTKLAEAQEALSAAKAADKDGNFRWAIYTISAAPKDAEFPEGTKGSDHNGYAVAVGFDRSAVKAAAMLKAALKHGKFFALQVIATKAHAKGTKQAKLAAEKK